MQVEQLSSCSLAGVGLAAGHRTSDPSLLPLECSKPRTCLQACRADMLCHSSEAGPESCLRFNSDLQAAGLCAHRSYEPGGSVLRNTAPARMLRVACCTPWVLRLGMGGFMP